jgi:GDP-4-dehydro-6-deoxy-D-mannose reductase
VKIAEEIDPAKFRPSDTPISYADPSKFKRQTGWEPQISFEQTCVDILNDWRTRIH